MYKLLLPLLLCSFLTQAQNILRVNNNVGVNAPYTTITAAMAAAGDNDIIMVEGSLVAYDNITINKKVTIVGPGYFLLENQNLQASSSSASLATITLANGGDGSSIYGLQITSQIIQSSGVTVNNITISNCRISGATYGIQLSGNINNLIVSSCYIVNTVAFFNGGGAVTGAILSNNYLGAVYQVETTKTLVTLTHNIIASAATAAYNCNFQNNIIIGPTTSAFTGSVLKNNVFTSTQTSFLTAGATFEGTNIFSALTSNLFVGLTGNTTDTQWKLKTGSPAIGAGIDGVDCGMYGGNTPYRPSGIQLGQPTITNFTTPASVQQNGTLNVKVSAKVN